MLFFDHLLFWWAQIGSKTGDAAKAANGAGGDAAGDGGGGSLGMGFFLPMMLALVVMLLLMRPRKGDTKLKERLKTLKKNDRVVTAGGILGTVIMAREDSSYVTLRIDEASNTKMQVLRSSIMRVIDDEDKKDDGSKKP